MFDIIDEVGVELWVLRDCWGEWGLEGRWVIQLNVSGRT